MDRLLRYRVNIAALLLLMIAAGAVALVFGWHPEWPFTSQRPVVPVAAPAGVTAGTAAAALATATAPGPIQVYVAGAVVRPGVYTLAADARVEQALQAAGGATSDAALDAINLAARLRDEEQVTVPRIGQPTVALAAQAGGSQPTTVATPSGPVDINKAQLADLETLPAIGPVLAQRILDYRGQHGPFARIEEIMNVPGIGQKLFDRIKDRLVVGSP